MGLCGGSPAPVWRWWQLPMVALCMVSYHSFTVFPYSIIRHGGAWYLLTLTLIIGLLALPVMFVQVRLGASTRRDVVSLLSKYIPGLQGVGVAVLLQLFILGLLVGVCLTYTLWYMFHAMASTGGQHYVWGRCDNSWNGQNCCPAASECTYSPGNSTLTPENEYFTHVVLRQDGTWNNLGAIVPHLVWPLFLSWLFVFTVVVGGPRVFPWVVGGVGVLGVLVVCMLMGYVYLTLTPARQVLGLLYNPTSFSVFMYPTVLVTDVAMFTVIWFGILPSYGKFCGRGKKISFLGWLPIIVIVIIIPNVVAIMLTGFYAALTEKTNTYLESDMAMSYTSYADFIITLSKMASRLQLTPFWGSMLFVPVFFFGAMFEGLIAIVITDSVLSGIYRGRLRYSVPKVAMRAILALIYCSVAFLISLPMVTKGGLHLYEEVQSSLFIFEFLYFFLFALALFIAYGRVPHLSILEKITVMTLFGISSVLILAGLIWSNMTSLDALVGMRSLFYTGGTLILFRLCVGLGPLLLCGIIGLIHALCVSPYGCEKRMVYTFGGDRFDEMPVEEEMEKEEEVAIPLEVEPDYPDEKEPPFPDVDLENYEEPEIIPLYPSPQPRKHEITV